MNSGIVEEPRRVVTWITLPRASAPYRTLLAPRNTSTWFAPLAERLANSNCSPDVVGGDTVDQHLIEVTGAAAGENRSCATSFAGLHDGEAGHLAERVEQIQFVEGVQLRLIKNGHRSAHLRFRQTGASVRNHDLLPQCADLEHHFDADRSGWRKVHGLAFLLCESGCFDSDEILANVNRREGKASFLVRLRNADDFPVLEQGYVRIGDNRPERIDNLAPNRTCRAGPCDGSENGDEECQKQKRECLSGISTYA